MKLDTIRKTFGSLFNSGLAGDHLTVVWHAGEPMVLPISYYREAFETIESLRPAEVSVTQSFQTNGTLITEEWCIFIKESKLRIGVSLDGPEWLNNKNRITRSGAGSFESTIRGVRLLRSHDIQFSIIAVLTSESLQHPFELYQFFVSEGIQAIGFNIEEVEAINLNSSLQSVNIDARYANFVEQFWRLCLSRKDIKYVREIEQTFASILRPKGTVLRNSTAEPLSMLNVQFDGGFSTFCPELLGIKDDRYNNFVFWNFHENSNLMNLFNNEHFLRFDHDVKAGLELCRTTCEYFSACGGGGSPVNKLAEKRFGGHYRDHVLSTL